MLDTDTKRRIDTARVAVQRVCIFLFSMFEWLFTLPSSVL